MPVSAQLVAVCSYKFVATEVELKVLDVHMHAQKFLMQPGIPTETAVRVYKRYLRLEPSHTEEYIAYLKSKVLLRLPHTLRFWCASAVRRQGVSMR